MSGYPPDTTLASRLIGNWWELTADTPPLPAGQGVRTALRDRGTPALREQLRLAILETWPRTPVAEALGTLLPESLLPEPSTFEASPMRGCQAPDRVDRDNEPCSYPDG